MHKYTFTSIYFTSEEKTEELFVVMDTSRIKRRRNVNVSIVQVFYHSISYHLFKFITKYMNNLNTIKHLHVACEKGYTGENCENACPFPTYGLDCQSICNCTELFCDHVNGCGNSTDKSVQNICNGYVLFLSLNILQRISIYAHLKFDILYPKKKRNSLLLRIQAE